MWHTWRATREAFTCIYLVLLLFLSISLEGALVETLLSILGDTYFIISWSFGMVKTLICPYLLGFVLWRWSTCYFGVLTTSFLMEHSIYLASCTLIHGIDCLGIHTWIGYMHRGPLVIFGGWLWSILLGGIFYCFISQAPWGPHFVSSSRWTLENILLGLTLFYYTSHASILEGKFHVDILHVDLVFMPIFSCTPSLRDF
jgi:hypothetical protein